MKAIIFDSHAILRFSQDEAGADRVEELLVASRRGDLKAYINEINLGEIYYMTIRRIGLESAKGYLEHFFTLPIQIIAPSCEIIMSASEVKAQYAISYADCFAVATALQVGASIVTGDPEFKKVENLVEIKWI